MPGLLYPAYQKLYNALNSLDRFRKESNFFDNISAIDNFFNEYRNITFVMQASLKHTDYFDFYEKNRGQYITDHWFVDKRNETIKQKPFRLIKEITITLYLPFGGFRVCEKKYSVENDTPLYDLLSELKKMLAEIDSHEVCFSVSFSFHEEGSDIDLLEKVMHGIASMKRFMAAMEQDIGEECALCNQIKREIDKFSFINVPLDFLHTNDYVYYPDKDLFDKAQRISLMMDLDDKKVLSKEPLKYITQPQFLNYDGTAFGNFTLLHVMIQRAQLPGDIMPVIMIVYDDNTYDLDAFAADMKTTMYRKINETAQNIYKHNVSEVCYVALYSKISLDENTPKTSYERIQQATTEFLVCASVDKQLNVKEYVFDKKHLENMEYIACIMENGLSNQLNVSVRNLFPIIQAFKNKSLPD